MKHIRDFIFRGHEIIVYQDTFDDDNTPIENSYTVDVRADSFDGDIIAGYSEFKTEDDAKYCGMAFVDGLKQGERIVCLN